MASYIWSKDVYHYLIKALNGIHHWEDARQDFFKEEINNRTPGNVYCDKKIISVVRVVVKRKWGYGFLSSIVLGVESYQRTINLTKPKLYFEGIDEKIPYIMTGTEKGVIQENLIDMLNKNKLVRSNERLKGRNRNDMDVKRSKEMVDKIDQVMKRIEQLRRLEEYIGGRLKIINPRVFVRPM
ncbi:hypothetical protein Tco_0837417 [Tanacetum coccineum]